MPRLFAALALARGDGRYAKLLQSLSRVRLLILDDWGPEPLMPEQARDLLEIMEDRFDTSSTLVTSQASVDCWHEMIGNPTLADAILDRLLYNAYRINLTGETKRKDRRRKAAIDAKGKRNIIRHDPRRHRSRWPASSRNAGRLQIGIMAGCESE